ncbi:cell division cycle-associated protein 7a isoform X2 [Salminus brasiliensis]|uniref:cell division cycle-associated protein 7a isoform X2 n=1 Tax=Salminus brasiliensis TaxID=930266 RepID=UPI003B82D855
MRTKRQQPLPPTRMNLRSYRNSPLVPIETSSSSSSSSDDSCDSFGSDGFTTTKPLRQTRHSTQRGKVFQSPPVSEEEACSGFEENCFSNELNAMKMDSDSSDSAESPKRPRRSFSLKVAMKFPNKKGNQKKSANPQPAPKPKNPEPDSDEEENFIAKRALNIKENKAMLAKLMSELNKVPGLFPKRMSLPITNTPRRVPRRSLGTPASLRKNPERMSRPHTRSRSLVDGPPTPPPEEEPEDKFSLVRRARYSEDGDDESEPRRRRSYNGILAIPHVVRPVEEITQLELDNICSNVREKIYNRSTGSTCHQCRQKTTDTKTNCRNPECVGVRGQFCGPCLRNRYGEEVRDALLDPEWRCPPCRGICNCSFCRARDGRCATGVLVYLAKYHGYDNVHAYLNSLRKELEESD